MAAKNAFSITYTKHVDGVQKVVRYSGTGKEVILQRENVQAIYPTGTSDEDSLFVMTDGSYYIGQEDFADVQTDISATDLTGS